MEGRYPTEEAAQRRVEQLKTHGIWPGRRKHDDGSWSLLYDPEVGASVQSRIIGEADR